jgi:hypothetical protein
MLKRYQAYAKSEAICVFSKKETFKKREVSVFTAKKFNLAVSLPAGLLVLSRLLILLLKLDVKEFVIVTAGLTLFNTSSVLETELVPNLRLRTFKMELNEGNKK